MELAGKAAPPMANGEVVFEAPWQGRTFGMARTLCEQGLFEWDEFRECLIEEIEAWERSHPGSEDHAYYDRFLAALTRLLEHKQILGTPELDKRTAEFRSRPHGHDHSGSGSGEMPFDDRCE